MLFYGKILLRITQRCKGTIKVLYLAVHKTEILCFVQIKNFLGTNSHVDQGLGSDSQLLEPMDNIHNPLSLTSTKWMTPHLDQNFVYTLFVTEFLSIVVSQIIKTIK
jgi:hypothetical protein